MESGCKRIVREEVIGELLSDHMVKRSALRVPSVCPTDLIRYHTLLNAAYVSDSASLRWCPHPRCDHIIECTQAPPRLLNQIVPTVRCTDGRELCFGWVDLIAR